MLRKYDCPNIAMKSKFGDFNGPGTITFSSDIRLTLVLNCINQHIVSWAVLSTHFPLSIQKDLPLDCIL